MRTASSFRPLRTMALAISFGSFACGFSLMGFSAAYAQVSGEIDLDVSQESGNERECAIIANPSNKDQVFVACNKDGGPGLFAARSVDGGRTWIDRQSVGDSPNQAPTACCDPSLAWDTLGNLYLTYLNTDVPNHHVVTWLSTDDGVTFTPLADFAGGAIDQPTIVAADISVPGAPSPVAVWIVWNEDKKMRARGAAVKGNGSTPGNIGPFAGDPIHPGDPWTINAPEGCTFGDVAIAPSGAVVNVCQDLGDSVFSTSLEGPSTIFVNIKADGLNSANFGPPIPVTVTNVGAVRHIPAYVSHNIDAEAGLAFDRYPSSPHFGRLYLVYTDATAVTGLGSEDTNIIVRFSDNNGANWSGAIRVNDDATSRSQFLPRIASNPLSGNIAVCWLDARNDINNEAVQTFCSIATPTGSMPVFLPNGQISDGASISNGQGIEFGDYAGLTYFEGLVHPAWGDTSNSAGHNPDNPPKFDAYTDRVTGGPAASEGEPHITTVDGVHYDFQSAGEFVALRGDGLEIQTRQTAIATPFPSPNPHTGLATCVSLNSAVATRVGEHRITYQPNISGVPDPSGLQLRIDGNVRVPDTHGFDLGSGGRVVKSSIGDGIEIDFPNGTHLIATPRWWASQSKWYMNVNVYHTTATEGIMGVIARGSWLPALPDGTSLGSMPAGLHDRYIDLNKKFANGWRVTNETSLFDYKPGTSTSTFTVPGWPLEKAPCAVPKYSQTKPLKPQEAQRACENIIDKNRMANCIFDVTITGEAGFAETYQLTERLETGATKTNVTDDKQASRFGETVTFTATVSRKASKDKGAPGGKVQFIVDGSKVEPPVALDGKGRAAWKTANLKVGKYEVAAEYRPSEGNKFLPSISLETSHTVINK